jgi:cytochrome c oxidase cbb3-type subunit 1
LFSREVARLGFWTLAFVGALGGTARLSGGPVPNWLASVGIAANVVMLVSLACVAVNIHETLQGRYRAPRDNYVLKFMVFATGCYLMAGMLNALTSLRGVGALTLFTHIHVAIEHLMILGFFGMAALGCVHYILPRVTGLAWPSETMMRFHFNSSAAGVLLYITALLIAGFIQGSKLNNPDVEFMMAIKSSIPLLGLATLGLIIFLAGQVALLIQVQKITWRMLAPIGEALCAACCGSGANPAALKAEVKS